MIKPEAASSLNEHGHEPPHSRSYVSGRPQRQAAPVVTGVALTL